MTKPASADGQPFITINGRRIGPGQPTYVIAEMSANHNQDFGHAVEILEAARAAGADAVKLQTYTADTHDPRLRQPVLPRRQGNALGGPHALRPLRGGPHALGLAARAQEDRGRPGHGSLLVAVRRHGRRLPRVDAGPRLQDRVVRDRRPAAHQQGRRARGKPIDHVDRHGDAGGDRRRPSTRRAQPAARRSLCSSAPAPTRRRRRR